MGIPAFAKTITQKYPNIVTSDTAIKSQCGRLFLDLNCAIHPVAQRCMKTFKDKASYEDSVVKSVIDYIYKIVAFSKPHELLFIAIDGIPPRAKMSQQRKRRYVSSWRKDEVARLTGMHPFLWDTNAITPGTDFMNTLSSKLHQHFEGTQHTFDIIFRDSNTPGEGEAKIMDYIGIAENTELSQHDVIYGLDADLIMLSLASIRPEKRSPPIYLLREPTSYDVRNSEKPFLYFDITLLNKCISIEVGAGRVWDYILLCFLLGNDFMPPLSYLKIKNKGIDSLMGAYHKSCVASNEYLVHATSINFDALVRLLECIKDDEDTEIIKAESIYFKEVKPFHNAGKNISPVDRVLNEMDTFPMTHKMASVKPQKSGWRLNYYNQMFKTTDLQDINDICKTYCEAIVWTHAYYFNRSCISNNWCYRYEYSPSALDLHNYLTSTKLEDVVKGIEQECANVEFTTDLQLLMVLPPASIDLIKPPLRSMMNDVSLGCVYMYPSTFSIGTYLKSFLWECHPELPPMDVCKIRETAFRVASTSS